MHRIDTSTAQKDKFGSGKNGFTGGNPQTGQLPTALDENFFDAVQEEICRVIEEAGLEVDKNNHAQMIEALSTLFASQADFTAVGKDLIGKATKADVLQYLGLGTAALKNVGVGANQIPDMSSFTSGAGTNSQWFKFPNGTIVQSGYVVTSSSTSINIIFPTQFLNAVGSGGVAYSLSPTSSTNIIAGATGSGLSSISGVRAFNTSGTQIAAGLFWIATGN